MFLRVVVLFILAVSVSALVGRTQSSGVRGRLMCDNQPAHNVLVKLYDDDRGLDADDLLAEGRTDHNGGFELSGYTEEFTPIDPKLNVYHDCNDGIMFTIKIPDSYISEGKFARKIYDAGQIQLSGAFPGESRDCLH